MRDVLLEIFAMFLFYSGFFPSAEKFYNILHAIPKINVTNKNTAFLCNHIDYLFLHRRVLFLFVPLLIVEIKIESVASKSIASVSLNSAFIYLQ